MQGWCVVSLCVCAMYHCASWESAQWGDFPADIETPLTSARCSRAPHMQRNIRMRRLVMCRDVAMSPCLLLGHMLYLLLVYVVSSFECHRWPTITSELQPLPHMYIQPKFEVIFCNRLCTWNDHCYLLHCHCHRHRHCHWFAHCSLWRWQWLLVTRNLIIEQHF